jgi:hypothetical protein
MNKVKFRVFTFVGAFLLTACNNLSIPGLPTPYPTEYLPTVIALTLEAGRKVLASPATPTYPPTQPEETVLATPPEASITPNPTPSKTPNPPTPTQPAQEFEIPKADIQIRGLGQLSKVASPITVYAYLKPGAENRVQIELLGEGNRVLARQIKVLPWVDRYGKATLYMKLDFEISATAEAARLKISVTDEFGRITAVNSVPLILISIGESDILPPADSLAPIAIQLPTRKSLIQGKSLLVHGWARPSSDDYLMLQLVGEDGRVLGKRVTNIETAGQNGYGIFTAEVPFFVTGPTPAVLVVWEGEGSLSNIIHLSSVEVLLSP